MVAFAGGDRSRWEPQCTPRARGGRYVPSWQALPPVLCAAFVLVFAVPPLRAAATSAALDQAGAKVVKLYGAGGFRGLEAYQSGVLISPQGHILTAFSYVLDSDTITAVLADGRRFEAKLLGADPRLEIAVLKIEAERLPYFTLDDGAAAAVGDKVYALSNAFGVATGDEPATVQAAVIAARTTMSARRGAFQTPYRGPIYVIDSVTNNPGAAGGALVTRGGDIVGLLGKELRNALNNTWLNYALPVDVLRPSVEAIRGGKFLAERPAAEDKKSAHPTRLTDLGMIMMPDLLERTPPFVDEVIEGSPASNAGLRADDLVVLVGDRLIQSQKMFVQELEYIERGDAVRLAVVRGQELIEIVIQPPTEQR